MTEVTNIFRSRPWYWLVGGGLVILSVLAIKPMFEHWMNWASGRLLEFVWLPGVALYLLTSAWLFGVAPWLDAGDVDRSRIASPHRRFRTLRFMVWAPLGLAVLCTLTSLVIFPVVWYLASDRFFIGLRPWMTAFPVSLTVTAVYGVGMSRLLRSRVERAARDAVVCYHCGYSLIGAPSTRCPECGEPTLLEPDPASTRNHP